ncbi:Coiled-coil domain containing protein 103 [Dissostichus eleginoides]|uniref:Coiled-coil domain containing protein 103 n=1 Tax=Dissostichus eleginoides TaxID=100907 RepID=A0AAD9ES51_DISEL|nr:Coiled-coil domain containing protein 103 [Dissostichus eleginoides]
MARSERDVIDFSALQSELQAAVESERKHERENNAKLRAVRQGVCYSQFSLWRGVRSWQRHGNSPGTLSPPATADDLSSLATADDLCPWQQLMTFVPGNS